MLLPKTAEQQAGLMLMGVLDRLIRNQTQLANAIRGFAAELGVTAVRGIDQLPSLLDRLEADDSLPTLARELFACQAEEYAQLQVKIADVDAKLAVWQKAQPRCQRLLKIPGVGAVGAALLAMKTPAPELFKSGRQFSAWLGLTPKDHSTAGKARLGVITRAGDEGLRAVLVAGATAIVSHVRAGTSKNAFAPWVAELLKRKAPKLVPVALTNKMARIAWKLMATGQAYKYQTALKASASGA